MQNQDKLLELFAHAVQRPQINYSVSQQQINNASPMNSPQKRNQH